VSVETGLGSENPHEAFVGEGPDGIHQGIYQVTVLVAPPQQHDVDDLVGILVEHFPADGFLNRGTNAVVGILIPAQFLHHHVSGNPEFLSVVLGIRRGDHGGVLLLLMVCGDPAHLPFDDQLGKANMV